MAVNSTGVPLFAGIEDLDDMFISTMEEMDKEISAELVVAHPFWEYIQRHNLVEMRDEIGTHVPVRRNKTRNPTVQWITGYDDANSTPASLLDEAKFGYGHLTARQLYNREELVKNSGAGQMIDLVEGKADQAFSDMNEEFANTIMGTQDADGRRPVGLGRLMDEAALVGNVDPAADPTWKPNRIYKTGTTNFTLATEFRDGIRKLYRAQYVSAGGATLGAKAGGGMRRRLFVCGEDLYNEHQKWAETTLKMSLDDIKGSSGWGDYEMFDFMGKTILYETMLPAKEGWFLDMERGVRVRIHTGTNFKWTPWALLPQKVEAKYRDLLTYVCVYSKSRRANARIVYT
jgi:hypothetical protein